MKNFADYNPIAVFIYFLAAAGMAMFTTDPVILAFSLVGSVLFFIARNGRKGLRSHLFFFVLFLLMALINPLFYHNGVTVLFVMNDNPVTLEALLYGIASSAMIVSVLYWFRSFSQIMTGDKLLYLFGSASPKLSLILSMTLRYIPLFGKQAKKVDQAQKALGLYKEDNIIDRMRGGTRVFSVMVTWALENGIITADSMTARGYGIGRRTFFSLYRFRKSDLTLTLISLGLLAATAVGIGFGVVDFTYYPEIAMAPVTAVSAAAYAAYGLLAFMPAIMEAEESIKWKYLLSKT
ncbi:MAG TPA: energy-coupling factor transporter transmembrane component T [Oscillospiraceae bacterium]|nr:energy-coupling factor transporter transmembrane component T [Oscillospiraceae bacterium]HPF55200.1 energy-coupling factor transporter transmembrane component T [Clostridiales bacterium]HPK36416.1 energy-coupling factor transporter transmembrane component T [Oscillospiraceae bacterium]HPR75720.1 energy-coupling factor transporter transmembrane component T [Oscillospiraceae bacterium]